MHNQALYYLKPNFLALFRAAGRGLPGTLTAGPEGCLPIDRGFMWEVY